MDKEYKTYEVSLSTLVYQNVIVIAGNEEHAKKKALRDKLARSWKPRCGDWDSDIEVVGVEEVNDN